jgi:NAD(P)-dependent dehydrogenase (short-subunit alcohol dehydrogenase family)
MNQVRNYSNKERIAVVTGSSKGIGKAIAMEFAKAGYSVVINARNEEELKQAAEDISISVRYSAVHSDFLYSILQLPASLMLIE